MSVRVSFARSLYPLLLDFLHCRSSTARAYTRLALPSVINPNCHARECNHALTERRVIQGAASRPRARVPRGVSSG